MPWAAFLRRFAAGFVVLAVSVAPSRLVGSHDDPRLAPWAAFLRRFAAGFFFLAVSAAPLGLPTVRTLTHGWRRGLHSYAASRLGSCVLAVSAAPLGLPTVRTLTHG
jgi:hypothetical protein